MLGVCLPRHARAMLGVAIRLGIEMLTSGLDFAVQELFAGSLKAKIRQQMERQLGAWLTKAMGLEQIKVDAVARVGVLIDKFCNQALPQLGIPVSKELCNDIQASMADLIEGACSGALDPDGKLGALIEVSNAMIMSDFKRTIGSFLEKRLPASTLKLEYETAKQWQKWTNARKLLHGRSGPKYDEVLGNKIEKAETDLCCKLFCLGLLSTLKEEVYEEKGFFKKMLNIQVEDAKMKRWLENMSEQRKQKLRNIIGEPTLHQHDEYWGKMGAGVSHSERMKTATTNILKKQKLWNAHMPVLIQVLRTLGVGEGEQLQILEIFRQIEFVPPVSGPGTRSNRLFREDELTTFLPPAGIERGKKEESRYDQARGLGSVLETLTSVMSAQALTAIDEWVELTAPGILKSIFLDAFGLDVDAPSRSVTELSVALKTRLKRFHHMMATNHQVHFENGLKHWANHPSTSKWCVYVGSEYAPTEGRDRGENELLKLLGSPSSGSIKPLSHELSYTPILKLLCPHQVNIIDQVNIIHQVKKMDGNDEWKLLNGTLLDLAVVSKKEEPYFKFGDVEVKIEDEVRSHDYFKFGDVYVKMASDVFKGEEVAGSIMHDVLVRKGVLSEGIMEWAAKASGPAVIREVGKVCKAAERTLCT